MTKERIRVLVDTSRDTGGSDGLIQIEPDNIYQTTNNRDYLSEGVLTNYDVLTICSSTALKYTDTELQLIREFVENGGGLLLATSTSRFERDVREPISELGINHVASLFGTQFFPLPEGQSEMDTDANPLRGYTKKEWMFKIVNLPMLLRELSPLLSKRLNESERYKDWQGTIGIKGSEHRASLTIKDGEIRVSEEVSEGTGICLSTDDDTITRFILGVTTPYRAYLQNQLHIAPTVNSSVTHLLGTLFPKH